MADTYEVRVKTSKARVLRYLREELAGQLAGRLPDTYGIGQAASLRMIVAALEDIHADYQAKSAGGAGADGTVWEPLHPTTIKHRRGKTHGQEGVAGHESYPVADHVWLLQTKREIYYRELRRLLGGGLRKKEAQKQAAIISRFMTRSLWQARAQALGKGRPGTAAAPEDFPILDDTGRLLASVSPGMLTGSGLNSHYSPAGEQPGDQDVAFENGAVHADSNVPYGDHHMRPGRTSKSNPGTVVEGGFRPARPWKYPGGVPAEWVDRWAARYAQAIAELLPEVLVRLGD